MRNAFLFMNCRDFIQYLLDDMLFYYPADKKRQKIKIKNEFIFT